MSHWDLKMFPWSSVPRFYPPGKHPAAAMYRDALRQAEAHYATYGSTPAVEEYLAYVREKIAEFESGEADAKARLA